MSPHLTGGVGQDEQREGTERNEERRREKSEMRREGRRERERGEQEGERKKGEEGANEGEQGGRATREPSSGFATTVWSGEVHCGPSRHIFVTVGIGR